MSEKSGSEIIRLGGHKKDKIRKFRSPVTSPGARASTFRFLQTRAMPAIKETSRPLLVRLLILLQPRLLDFRHVSDAAREHDPLAFPRETQGNCISIRAVCDLRIFTDLSRTRAFYRGESALPLMTGPPAVFRQLIKYF